MIMLPIILRYHTSSIFMLHNSARLLKASLFCLTFIFTTFYTTVIFRNDQTSPSIKKLGEIRNISYILERYKYYNADNLACKWDTKVIIGVISSSPNYEARNAIRNSWGKGLPSNWQLLFIIGKSKVENNKPEDDVIKTDVNDTYQNLPIKVGILLKWITENCHTAQYFLKVDDDVYINSHNMKNLIQNCTLKKFQNSCYWSSSILNHYIDSSGKINEYIAAGYVYENIKPIRNPLSKWYLEKDIYQNSTLPKFLSGTSYLLSTNIIPKMLKEAISIPLINLEDVYFTGLVLVDKMKLSLKHLNKWNNFRPIWDDPCYFRTLLTAHGLKPNELIEMNNAVNKLDNDQCSVLYHRLAIKINEYLSYYFPRVT